MQLFALIGFLAFFVASLTVGVRLIALWRRDRELPELLIGIGVLGIGPVGFGCLAAAQQIQASRPDANTTLLGIGLFAVSCGAFAKYTFNWRVYHPASPWARLIVVAVGLFFFGSFVYSALAHGFADVLSVSSARSLTRGALQVGCLLWGSAEALRYWGMMRRRVPLGLADPVVTNRFLMWAIGAGSAGVGSAVGLIAQLVTGEVLTSMGWVMVSSSMHGLVAAIAIGLAFIPPAPYLRWIRSRAGQAPIEARA